METKWTDSKVHIKIWIFFIVKYEKARIVRFWKWKVAAKFSTRNKTHFKVIVSRRMWCWYLDRHISRADRNSGHRLQKIWKLKVDMAFHISWKKLRPLLMVIIIVIFMYSVENLSSIVGNNWP